MVTTATNKVSTMPEEYPLGILSQGKKTDQKDMKPCRSKNWYPIWLEKTLLYSFAILFTLLGAGLVLVNHFMGRHDGLPLWTSNYYVWTYGPTAILVAIISLWRQVVYCTMVNQPWHELSCGPKPAETTVLLEYLSPLLIVSLTRAVKNRHLAVVAGILVLALLKLITIMSTGLFKPNGLRSSTESLQLKLDTKFDPAYLRSLTPPYTLHSVDARPGHEPKGLRLADDEIAYDNILSEPVWTYRHLSMYSNEFNTNASWEFAEPTAYIRDAYTRVLIPEPFWSRYPRGSFVFARVKVFRAEVDCESAVIDWSQHGDLGPTVNLTLHTQSCNIGRLQIPRCNEHGSQACSTPGYYFVVKRVDCADSGVDKSQTVWVNEDTPNTYQYAFIGVASSHHSNPTTGHNETRADRAVAVSCGLSHSEHWGELHLMESVTMTVDNTNIQEADKNSLLNFTNLQFSEAVFSSLQSANEGVGLSMAQDSMGARALLRLVVDRLNSIQNRNSHTLEELFDDTTLRSTTRDVLAGVGWQVFQRYFMRPDDSGGFANASLAYYEERLLIRQSSQRPMVGLLGLAALGVLVVAVCVRTGVAPPSPSALLSGVSVLAASPDMMGLLSDAGAMRTSQLREGLRDYDFIAVHDGYGSLRIEAQRTRREPRKPGLMSRILGRTKPKPKTKRPWMPYSARGHAIALTLLLPTASIGILELLWQISVNDIQYVPVLSATGSFPSVARYITIATAFLIAGLFNSLDFNIATMTPFSVLAGTQRERGGGEGASPERTVMYSILGHLLPVTLYRATRLRHYGAAMALVASTIGSTLTIVASGLWVRDSFSSRPLSARIQTGWAIDFGSINSTLDNTTSRAALQFDKSQHNISYHRPLDISSLIRDDIAVPAISWPRPQIPADAVTREDYAARFRATVPAMRARLECEPIPKSSIVVDLKKQEDSNGVGRAIYLAEFSAAIPLPAGCVSSLADEYELGWVTFSQSLNLSGNGRANTKKYMGTLQDLPIVPDSSLFSGKGCPSLGILFGSYFAADIKAGIKGHTILGFTCTQRLQIYEVEEEFDDHGLSPYVIPYAKYPLPDLGSIDILVDPLTRASSLSYAMARDFERGTTPFIQQSASNFFDHLTMGPEGLSPESLLNADTLLRATSRLYRKFMVHVIDLDYRALLQGPESSTESQKEHLLPLQVGEVLRGQLEVHAERLKINEAPKIVLQVLLGTLAALGGLAYWLVGMRGVLPRNPHCIASRMALFGGSRLLSAMACDETEVDEGNSLSEGGGGGCQPGRRRSIAEIFQGKLLRLGWWEEVDAVETADEELLEGLPPTVVRRRFGIDIVQEGGGV